MRLKKILDMVRVEKIINYKNYNIKAITHNSKDVIKDSIFIAINGSEYDGNDYINDAIKLGAKCIVTDRVIDIENVCIIVVKNVRKTMSVMAKNFYNKVCDNITIVGVIGTSGKTTTTHIIKQLLQDSGKKIGVIGTNGIFIDNIRLDNNFTTPDPLELHYTLYQMKMLGVDTVIMEVSAQAISQYKMYGIRLKVGVFTNITEEHIDFFGTMENYVKTKVDYFTIFNMDEAIINVDDFYGREIAYRSNLPIVSIGIESPANVFALDIVSNLNSLNFVVNVLDDVYSINTKLVGKYNVYNIMSAITVTKLLGVSTEDICDRVNKLKPIEGRFNVFRYNGANVIIDFAHTVDSIDKLLSFVEENKEGKIITLFGCVGYSDREKRRNMTDTVLRYSDYMIITTDNRGETAFVDIEKDMVDGISPNRYTSIEDRKSAIIFGLNMLRENDTLVIMGKGAETFQKIGKEKIPYSDIDIVQELIKKTEVR